MSAHPPQPPDSDDFEVELLAHSASYPAWEPTEQPGMLVARAGRPWRPPLVAYALWALQDVLGHGSAESGREVGGVLIGRFVDSRQGPMTRVDDIIIADSNQASLTHVTFTHEAWSRIHSELERRGDGALIVGWYHTHPDFGPFLSAHDLFIHQNFFTDPLHVALVFDPVRRSFASFGWHSGAVSRADGCLIWAEADEAPELSTFLQTVTYVQERG